jgi:hypothetical protein
MESWDDRELLNIIMSGAKGIVNLLPPDHRKPMDDLIRQLGMVREDNRQVREDKWMYYLTCDIYMLSLDSASAGCLYVGQVGMYKWLPQYQFHQAMVEAALRHLHGELFN